MEDTPDFKLSLASITDHEGDSQLVKSIAISEYFRKLSLLIAKVIPHLLVKHVSTESCSDDTRVKELHSLMSDVVRIAGKGSLLSFFSKYSQKIISVINYSLPSYQHYKELAEYLDNGLCKDLPSATHLDVNDLVIAFKKGVLTECAELAQELQNELTMEDEFTKFLKTRLTRYEWVCKLTSMQENISQYLKIGKERSLNKSEKVGLAGLIGMNSLSDENIEAALKLLKHYGIIQRKEKGSSNHPIITITAASLSLSDQTHWLGTGNYKEVQFLCKECFYLDASIHYSECNVKNVVIVASKLIVSGEREIDVSGSDGKSCWTLSRASDGKGSGAHGKNGKSGEPGESGGNILICADEIENSELLTLCSKGGDGGDGQHGGNGQDGKAKRSKSDNLSRFGVFNKLDLITTWEVNDCTEKIKSNYPNVKSKDNCQAYGKSIGGVQVLYGRGYKERLFNYAFLYSRGVDGVSADGGNAGKGGRAGGGGKGGHIDIFMKNGIDHNLSHRINVSSRVDGCDGTAGEPGKPGKRHIAKSRTDYLVVDGFWKTPLRYSGFIDARKKTGKDSSRLDRGWYYCDPSVAKYFDSTMTDGYIEFFKVRRPPYCLTKYNSRAEDGKEQEQEEEVIHSTKSMSINKAETQMEYLIFSNEHLQVQDNSCLIQFLEEIQRNLLEKLEELETTYMKQQYKQIQRLDDTSDSNPVLSINANAKSILKLDLGLTDLSLPSEIIAKINDNPLVPDKEKISEKDSIQEVYSRLENLIEEAFVKESTRSLVTHLPDIYQLMESVYNPIFLIHLDRKKSLQNTLNLLHIAENKAPRPDFHTKISSMKQNIKPRYEWSKLSQAHQDLLNISTYSDKKFQKKAVAVYLKLCSQESIENIDEQFAKCFQGDPRSLKISPFRKPLKGFETSCSADLPLSSQTKLALEILMVFINEANEKSYGKFHFPNILQAIEREYKAYHSTISDHDLMFIMTYIQDKLNKILLERAQLENLFCENFLSEKEELGSYKGGFIFYQEESYPIVDIKYLPREHEVHVISRHDTFKINLQNLEVMLNGKAINFPEALLISKLDIKSIWKDIEATFIKGINDKKIKNFLNKVSLPKNEYKYQLAALLQQACTARDIQFDVFSFQPPSLWVEKLILSTVQKQYNDHDPNFVAKIETKIDGLSQCYDKSLYCTIYMEFLQETFRRSTSFKVNLLEALKRMCSIFIDQNLCSLVTEQGMTQIGIKDADYIFSDLIDSEIIDSTGMFLPHITEHRVEQYCSSQEVDALFLKTVFTMQKCIGQLSGKELSLWNHKLGELHLQLTLQLTGRDNDVCDMLLVHIYQMQKHYGEQKVLEFVELVWSQSQRDISSDKLVDLFSKCSSKEWIFSIVNSQIERSKQVNEGNSVSPLLQALDNLHSFDWEAQRNKECTAEEIIESIKSQHPSKEHLFSVLDAIKENIADIKEKEKSKSQFYFNVDDEQLKKELNSLKINKYSKHHIGHWATKFKEDVSSRKSLQNSHLIEAFAVMRRGVTLFYETEKNEKGVAPRDTQMVASLLFFQNLSAQGGVHITKLLQQISTGEGKTMILCMVAIYKVLIGEKVDIVTSSSVLATRDATDLKPLYALFNISVSHCCHEELSKRHKAYEADIVYGDISHFQRDILETYFYDLDIRTERRCDNVFVDEVDSMLVDKGQNMLYLPHALPDMNCLDQIYLEIWSLVNAKDFLGLEQEQEELYFALRHKLLGAIAPNTFTEISGISEKQSENIFESLVKNGTIDSNDHCLTSTNFTAIKDCVETFMREKHIRNEILMIIQQHIEAKPLIQGIPKALHPFIKKSLRSWIHSAVCAKYFHHNKEYIIDIDRRESASDRYPRIIIMDIDTGVEQESSEWGSGLHQFLQLKHNLRLSTESLKAVYMSNISFFKRYKNIIGVTGTLGEHKLFKQLYENTLIVEIPTNKPSRLIIELPVCCSTKEEWEQAVYSDVQEKLRNNRAVLLICEDIKGARDLHHFLNFEGENLNPVLYFSSHQEKLEERARFKPRQLIIATNLAGRGTDIKLNDEVRRNGGLHVCLSYLPPNVRVELQAYGRAARCGDPGSCRMIFHDKEGDLNNAIQKRNLSEAYRIDEIEADYFKNIKFQEELFQKFKNLYCEIRFKNKDEPECRVVLDYCLDCWAFFLDLYTDAIESIPKKSYHEAKSEKDRILLAFKNEVQMRLNDFVIDKLPPSRLMQVGHTFMKRELKRGNKFKDANNKPDFEKAVSLYKQAAMVSNDPFASYYLAAAQLNTNNKGKIALKQTFYEIIPLFQHKIRQCQTHAIMLQLANRHQNQTLTGNVQYFQEQKQHEIELYSQFISSMQDIIGKEITLNMFDHTDWGEEGAWVLFKIVQEEFSLKHPRIAKNYCKRLDSLLSSNESYFTYEVKIREKVKYLRREGKEVSRDDFIGVLPDKEKFWSLLKEKNLITRETKTVLPLSDEEVAKGIALRDELIGYWNPSTDIDKVQLESWDCLDIHSFDWIEGLKEEEKEHIYSLLKEKHILSSEGQLMDLDLVKPLEIPLQDSCVKYYKAIKDTLWHHTIYRFILDHLHDCAEIDAEKELSDSNASNEATTQNSVVDVLISLNPNANVSSEGEVNHGHIIESAPESAFIPESEDFPNIRDHVPTEALNGKFREQLMDNNLRATDVSGSGLNCMINAMIQHAKRDYHTPNFQEANTVRNSVKQKHPHLDLSGMLHCDDEIASEVLACVNDKCSSEIGRVSGFIASSDGPILYGDTSDGRFTSGKHVAIWQQGNHFVAIVHQQEFIESSYQVESDDSVDFKKEVPMISKAQLQKLESLDIVSKAKTNGKYKICKPIEEIESKLLKADSLPTEDRDQMRKFLTLKLEVDFKTLSNSPRVLASNQSHVLHDDLCLYAVIKGFKMKKTSKEIDNKCSKLKIKRKILNQYLKHKKIQELTLEQYKKMIESTKFLTDTERLGVENFVLLMNQFRSNATRTLKNQQSTILELETPEISLRRLADVFEDSIQDKQDVLGWFSDNQCDLVINLAEQKWSWKSIFTSLSVIAIGVAQIAVGAVLLVASPGSASFVCNGLISEGVSDMIFGIQGLVQGHCNWSQYFEHKKMSVAITIATAGIGAYLARGTEASRYAYKAFGNANKEVAKSTAKQTGKSLGKVMTKQVCKKIVKKAAGAAVDAGINLACNKIVEEMSQSIDGLSQCIVDSFDNMTEDEEFTGKVTAFLTKQNTEKAEKCLHQILTRVMQRKTFLEIWDYIESKLQIGANVATQAYGSASKHLQMANKKIKGKGLMKGIGYASRFAPLITETIKIGLVKEKMDLLKKELIQELDQHIVTERDKGLLNPKACKEILKKELSEMKQYLSQGISQRGRTIVTTCLQIVGQELKKHSIIWGKEIVIHKIKSHMDMRQLKKYERKLSTARYEENHSIVAKYERKLIRLMSCTHSPKVFAHLIEHHSVELGPAYAIPTLEMITGRRIKLVSNDGKPLLNMQEQHVTGEPIEIKFIPRKGSQPGHFFAGGESFSFDQHGNDCLIHAAMKGAGKTDYIALDIRKKIASACKNRNHPCYNYIKSGIARNYVEIALIGAGRPQWWSPVYPFLKAYGEEVQGISGLENWNRFNPDGKSGLRYMNLDICHILSWNDMLSIINDGSKTNGGGVDSLNKLVNFFLPTIEDVQEERSIFNKSKGREIFLNVYKNDQNYIKGASRAREIVKSFSKPDKKNDSDRKELEKYLYSAPGNLRLGDASINRKIKKSMDHNPDEQRSQIIYEEFQGCKHFSEPKKDEKGGIMTSYYPVKNEKMNKKRKK